MGRKEERAGRRGRALLPTVASLRQRQVKRVAHAQWHFQMQLSWGPLLIASVAHTEGRREKKEIHNFVEVVDRNLPPFSFKIVTSTH